MAKPVVALVILGLLCLASLYAEARGIPTRYTRKDRSKHGALSRAASLPSGWSYYNCVQDQGVRTLSGYNYADNSVTVETCIATCSGKGYTMAGLEYYNECWCGSGIANGGAVIASSDCNTPCTGNTAETCGGSFALSLYTWTNPTSNNVVTGSDTVTGSSTSTSTSTSTTSSTSSTVSTTSNTGTDTGSTTGTATGSITATSTGTSTTTSTGGVKFSVSTAAQPTALTRGAPSATCAPFTVTNTVTATVTSGQVTNSATPTTTSPLFAVSTQTQPVALTRGAPTTTCSTTRSTVTVTSTTTTTVAPAPTAYPTQPIVASSNTKQVWAHHIVGNTYSYLQADWAKDIQIAASYNIDGFALNIGADYWEPASVSYAYAAARAFGPSFKLFISFDVTSLSCSSTNDAANFQSFLTPYLGHPNAAFFNGKPIVSTFSGQYCTFGQSNFVNGWNSALTGGRAAWYFMPALFPGDYTSLPSYGIDAELNWGSAWPQSSTDINTATDQYFMSITGPRNYIPTVAPLFFVHFPGNNYIFRSDDWLYAERWEGLMTERDQIDQVEIVSWNDFGESHYIGPIAGDLPAGSQAWANANFPHTDIASLAKYYNTAWKTGAWPAITKDQVWVMARPHAASAGASSDGVGQPSNTGVTQDNFYVQAHLTAVASVTLCSSSTTCQTFAGAPGINRFSFPLQNGFGFSVKVVNGGVTTVNLASQAGYSFTTSPAQYNFNYLIQTSG